MRPNAEKDVVLECGCVRSVWGAVRVLGSGGKWYQDCPEHEDGKGKWGMQRILREASVYERAGFHFRGLPAPKRRSTKAPEWVRTMPGNSPAKARRNGPTDSTLF